MMNQRTHKMVLVLLALLVAWATVGRTVPQMRDQCIVRGAQIDTEGDSYDVTLLYHAVKPASDAADAKEQLAAAKGKGSSLAEAYADAETKLPGKPMYKLCDVMLLSGSESLSRLPEVVRLVAEQGKGWLAAKLLCTDQLPQNLDEEDVSGWYVCLQKASRHAPCLYQSQQYLLLVPQVAGPKAAVKGVMSVERDGDDAMRLTRLTTEEAQLLDSVQNGKGKLTLQLDQRQAVFDVRVSCRVQDDHLERRMYLIPDDPEKPEPSDPNQRQQALQQASALWENLYTIDARTLAAGEGDAKFLLMQSGKLGPDGVISDENKLEFVLVKEMGRKWLNRGK